MPQTRTGGVPQTRTGGRRHPKQGCAKYGAGAHETATAMQLRTAFTTCDKAAVIHETCIALEFRMRARLLFGLRLHHVCIGLDFCAANSCLHASLCCDGVIAPFLLAYTSSDACNGPRDLHWPALGWQCSRINQPQLPHQSMKWMSAGPLLWSKSILRSNSRALTSLLRGSLEIRAMNMGTGYSIKTTVLLTRPL